MSKDIEIKVNVDTSSAETSVNGLDSSLNKLGNTSSSTTSKVDKLSKTTKSSKSGMDNLSSSAKKAASAETQMGNAAATASTKVGKLANTTGQANNAVVEMGRIASDAEYGLRGMGNNISQLATQIFQLMASQTQANVATDLNTAATNKNTASKSTNAVTTKVAAKASKSASNAIATQAAVTTTATTTTLGFVGALKSIGTVMMGPLGALFLIQGAIAGITAWANSADDAAESTDGFSDSLSTLASKLRDLGLGEEQRAIRIEELIKLSKLKASLDNQTIKDDERRVEITERLTEVETELASALSLKNANEKAGNTKAASDNAITYNSLLKEQNKLKTEEISISFKAVESENQYADAKERVFSAQSNTLQGLSDEKAALIKVQKNLSTTSEEYDAYGDKIKEVQDRIDEIQGRKGKGAKDTSDRDKAAIDKEINAHLDKHKTLQKAEEDAAKRKYDKLYEDSVKYGYNSAEIYVAQEHALLDIKKKYQLLEQEGIVEANQRKNDLALNQQQWEDDNIETPYAKYLAKQDTIELEMEQLTERYETERVMYKDDKEKMLELEAEYLDASQTLNQNAADLTRARAEQLAADELAIQTEYEAAVVDLRGASFSAAEGGFDLLARLSDENKTLQGIAIVGENAVAVARIITETVATNKSLTSTAVSEGAKAIGSAASYDFAAAALHGTASATASAGIVTNNIAAGTAIATSVGAAATGLAALGESGNLTGGAAPSGSGAVDIPAPSFNLVEGSEGNQIQNSIQNAGDVPVRAYVVAQDVTSQQSLDRQIEANSGI